MDSGTDSGTTAVGVTSQGPGFMDIFSPTLALKPEQPCSGYRCTMMESFVGEKNTLLKEMFCKQIPLWYKCKGPCSSHSFVLMSTAASGTVPALTLKVYPPSEHSAEVSTSRVKAKAIAVDAEVFPKQLGGAACAARVHSPGFIETICPT